MNNTRYSNMSKQSALQLEQQCQEHDGAPFTNFCTAITCVKPLCPECVQNHYIHHKNMRTQPQLHSFKTLKNQCVNKIGNILNRTDMDDNEGTMNEINAIFQNCLHKIRQTRQNSRKVIDSYFLSLEDHVRKRMVSLMSEQSDLFQQLDKANNIVNQLKLLVYRLDNSREFLSSAQTIIRLDGQKIEDKVRASYTTVKNLKQHYKVNLHIQKNYQQKLLNFLSKSVFYGNYENVQTMPRIAQEIMAKNNLNTLNRTNSQENVGSSRRSDRERDDDRRSSVTRKSSSKSVRASKKNITGMNTFKESSPHKYLHFFQNDENILHYLDIEGGDTSFSQIELDISFKIPEFHKSIAIPNGDLYLVGGSIPNSKIKSQKIYKYDFEKNNLVYCNSLKYGRSSHSICFNSKYIYVLGGICNNQVITDKCERYDIINNKVQQIRPMNEKTYSFACCSFSGRYIYKFGGISEDNSISHYIQVFDEKEGVWTIVNPSVDLQGQKLLSLATSAAIQITQNQMIVMGGYSEDDEGQKQTYVLKVESGHLIKDINAFPLPYAEAFWNNLPIIQNKLVFAIQNISQGKDNCIQNYRRILVFDGQGWKCLNN